MKRFVAAGGAFAAASGILWFLLLMSWRPIPCFSRATIRCSSRSTWLALGMLGLVGWRLRTLRRDYRRGGPPQACA